MSIMNTKADSNIHDVFSILRMCNVTDPCLQHIVKAALHASSCESPEYLEAVKNIHDTAARAIQMHYQFGLNKLSRDKISEYMAIANSTKRLSTSNRCQVGAVLVDAAKLSFPGYQGVIATGCNFSPTGACECSHGLTLDETVHAEISAINLAKSLNLSIDGAYLFVTRCPCVKCAVQIYRSGIKAVYFLDTDHNQDGATILSRLGVFCAVVR